MSKVHRYKKRCQDEKHHIRMFVDTGYWEKFKQYERGEYKPTQPQNILRFMGRKFNIIARELTKTDEYEIILNKGIPETVADYHYQYRRVLKWAEEQGCYYDVAEVLKHYGLKTLYNSIKLVMSQGVTAFDTSKIQDLLKTMGTGAHWAVLLYMKGRCSKPTSEGGITELANETIAKDLGVSADTVKRAKSRLREQGVIEIISQNRVKEGNKYKTLTKTRLLV